MKSELFYYNSADYNRKLTNLCSSTTVTKLKFSILPDRQMSFVKIHKLPPAPRSKLRDMVRFQINKIYPGNAEDISFDFIPYKIGTGWKVLIYIIKDKYLNEILKNERFEGIVLPLQLLSKKEMHSFSNLIIYYPDMVELWTFENGIPGRVERHDRISFSIRNSLSREKNTLNPEKLMLIFPFDEAGKWEMEEKRGKTKKFSETLISIRKEEIYFLKYRVTNPDRITPLIIVIAFIFSLVLLALTVSKHLELKAEENAVNTHIENIRLETSRNREKLQIIEQLENELKEIQESAPVNVYELLLRTSTAIDSNTVVLSFGLKGKELTLTLRSRSALNNLAGIKDEFGNVRASNIRTHEDRTESYTVWVEIKK